MLIQSRWTGKERGITPNKRPQQQTPNTKRSNKTAWCSSSWELCWYLPKEQGIKLVGWPAVTIATLALLTRSVRSGAQNYLVPLNFFNHRNTTMHAHITGTLII
jgi:hypothetical protein